MPNYYTVVGCEPLESRRLLATHVVKDLSPDLTSKNSYRNSVEMDGWLYYWGSIVSNAGGSSYQAQLMKTRGTPGQTFQVASVQTKTSTVSDLAPFDHRVYFSGYDSAHGQELWCSDGTSAGTLRVADDVPGSGSSSPSEFAATESGVFYSANLSSGIGALFHYDGTDNGTYALTDASDLDETGSLIPLGDKVVFGGRSTSANMEPWVSDGTPDGTFMLGDLKPGPLASRDDGYWLTFAAGIAILNGNLLFSAAGQLYKTDGTVAGTAKFTNFPANTITDSTHLIAFNGKVYFEASGSTWASDGTLAGTQMVITGFRFQPDFSTVTPSKMYLLGRNPFGIYASDGTANGNVLLKEFSYPSVRLGDLPVTASLGDTGFFVASLPGSTDYELWKTDGTATGTELVADIYAGTTTSRPGNLVVFNEDLYFLATSNVTGRDLWRVDITPPNVTDGLLNVDATVQTLSIAFNDDVSTSLAPSKVTITNRDTGAIVPTGSIAMSSYDAVDRQGNFTFSNLPGPILSDGNYRVMIANVLDYAGNAMAAPAMVDFFFLQADANRDRLVDTQDFNRLAGNFGGVNPVFSQGDFNYDHAITSTDFDILISQFGKRLAPVAPSMQVSSLPSASPFANTPLGDFAFDDLIA